MPGSLFRLLTHGLTTLSVVACDLVRLLLLVSRSRRALAAANLFLQEFSTSGLFVPSGLKNMLYSRVVPSSPQSAARGQHPVIGPYGINRPRAV
jgi:hypothetical protein